MANRAHVVTNKEQADPYSGSSLVPMLVIGLGADLCGDDRGVGVELSALARHCCDEAKRLRKGASDEAIHVPAADAGLLRFARNDDVAYAVTVPPLLRRPIYCSSANTPVAIACATIKTCPSRFGETAPENSSAMLPSVQAALPTMTSRHQRLRHG